MSEKPGYIGAKFEPHFSKDGNPYDDSVIPYGSRVVEIKNDAGAIVERIDRAIFPNSWSVSASNTAATKYFRREGVPETGREVDVRQLVKRIAKTIAGWGAEQGYIAPKNAGPLEQEIAAAALKQVGAYNSPIWFNLGLNMYGINQKETSFYVDSKTGEVRQTENFYEHPQGSACFISHPDDSVEDMMRVAAIFSSRLFKGGSGIGSSWYKVRGAGEQISGGGQASGAKRFMDVQDAVARVIKSGGKTRRAAVLQNIPIWHPDMFEIIRDKYQEEEKARILIEAGSPSDWESHTMQNLRGQNVNISVLADDEFWRAYEANGEYEIKAVRDQSVLRKVKAREVLEQIAFAAHGCGDPGMQNFTTINRYNTCKNTGAIYGSNPCSEFMGLNNSACNLASMNLMKFRKKDGSFEMNDFFKAVELFITTQDVLIDSLSYPSEEIALNSHRLRPLGLGYANLGALLMSLGMPYDSDEARSYAAAITAAMNSRAWLHSVKLAKKLGAFEEYDRNKEFVKEVLDMHQKSAREIPAVAGLEGLMHATQKNYSDAARGLERFGMRNSQVTLLAPTGTIGFMMDCDTTGCEPDIALKKYKVLAGGGFMRIVNQTVPLALSRLGYSAKQIEAITKYIDEKDTIEEAPEFKEEHLPIFDCAFSSGKSQRAIAPIGHIKMLGALQPHLSGAISKTINCPESTSVEEIESMFYQAWKQGVKAVAIYRYGSKAAQPVTTKKYGDVQILKRGEREHLPTLRKGITQKVKIGNIPLFLRTGEYRDGRLGELFIDSLERGSEINRELNLNAIQFSEKIQYGVPFEEAIEVFARAGQSQISGFTDHAFIKDARGIEGFLFKWLGAHYSGDVSFLFHDDGKPTAPEIRPLPHELRVYQHIPKLHLLPSVAGAKMYQGVPSLEETIEKVSKENYWKDSFDGLDTRKTIEKIKRTRVWRNDNSAEVYSKEGRLVGRVCEKCGGLMSQDGNCWKCPICLKAGGCGGGGG